MWLWSHPCLREDEMLLGEVSDTQVVCIGSAILRETGNEKYRVKRVHYTDTLHKMIYENVPAEHLVDQKEFFDQLFVRLSYKDRNVIRHV